MKLEDLLAYCIACHIVAEGTEQTESGNFIFYNEELTNLFQIEEDLLNKLKVRIDENLSEFKQVADIEIDDEYIDVVFYLGFCGIECEEEE